MSKRGRRRNSKRRKSSSSSKQSVSPYIFQKQNKSNSVIYKDDIVEKGEKDSLRKENVLSGSEDEEQYNNAPPKEKRFKQDYHVHSLLNQRSIYLKTTEDKERGVKIVTSVSVNDMDDSSPNITFQQSREPLTENPTTSSVPVTNIMKINCSGSHVKLEIQEILQVTTPGIKTTFVYMNEGGCAETLFKHKCDRSWIPNNESYEQPSQNMTSHNGNENTNYRFTFSNLREQTEADSNSKSVTPTKIWDNANYSQCCSDHKRQISKESLVGNFPLMNIKPQGKREYFHKCFSSDQSWDIPPPQEFADIKYTSLEDITHDLAACRIGACSPSNKEQRELHHIPDATFNEESEYPFSVDVPERQALSPSFDHFSESDKYEPMLMRPSLSTNRSSFTKDFINNQKRKSWIRHNSIATVEHKACLLPKKRRQTFPGMSEGLGLMQEDLLLPCNESFSSLIMCSLPLQAEGQDLFQGDDRFSAFGIGNVTSLQQRGNSKQVSGIPSSHDESQFCMTSSEDNPDDTFTINEQCQSQICTRCYHKVPGQQFTGLKQCICTDMESQDTDDYKVDQSEVADSGFDQELGEVEYQSPEPLTEELSRRALAIQVIPPSCSGSQEQMPQSHPVILFQSNKIENTSQEDLSSAVPKHSRSSVMTITVGALEQRFLQMDSRLSPGSGIAKQTKTALEDPCMFPAQDRNVHSLNTNEVLEQIQSKPFGEKTGNSSRSPPLMTEKTNDLQLDTGRRAADDSDKPVVTASRPAKSSTLTEIQSKEQSSKTDKGDKQTVSRCFLDNKEHLKPVIHKDADNSGSDHWAKRRKLFKESKQWSSAGGSSITSDITEESVPEDTRSMDMTVRDNEDRGFYTETFHSSAWIYQGDDVGSGAIPPSLNTRTRAVSIRERTVKISKGSGEYPWGFRIQFSKPIVVTEVDTNGAAEEAGLMVGDYVLAVNGTDVTSIPHSEAADLARQGPDLLMLTIGSDIARGPNTPRPACRGYLHKRTQSGLIKGWRKRWFVLTHDCCLYYYRHKRDEGKRQPLSAVKLEGAEVGQDISLGKPFVFKCHPQSGNRVYFFCATSNQEMKRWLEAMERAIHPITQNHVWVDVTKHNSNLPPLAVKNPECLGLLHKMDKSRDMWVQHYCILKDGCLFLYSSIRATHAHGGIYLQGYTVREQPYGSKKSTIELKPPSDEFKTFYFCAENPNENKRWIIAIKASIKKWLPLHQALQDYMNRPPEETRM